MKATGIVRAVDELGRIVIPKETRRVLNIKEKDSIEFYIDGESIVLKKYSPGCVFCGNVRDVQIRMGKKVCGECAADIRKKF